MGKLLSDLLEDYHSFDKITKANLEKFLQDSFKNFNNFILNNKKATFLYSGQLYPNFDEKYYASDYARDLVSFLKINNGLETGIIDDTEMGIFLTEIDKNRVKLNIEAGDFEKIKTIWWSKASGIFASKIDSPIIVLSLDPNKNSDFVAVEILNALNKSAAPSINGRDIKEIRAIVSGLDDDLKKQVASTLAAADLARVLSKSNKYSLGHIDNKPIINIEPAFIKELAGIDVAFAPRGGYRVEVNHENFDEGLRKTQVKSLLMNSIVAAGKHDRLSSSAINDELKKAFGDEHRTSESLFDKIVKAVNDPEYRSKTDEIPDKFGTLLTDFAKKDFTGNHHVVEALKTLDDIDLKLMRGAEQEGLRFAKVLDVIKSDGGHLDAKAAASLTGIFLSGFGVYLDWKAETVDSHKSFADWALEKASEVTIGGVIQTALAVRALGMIASTGPYGLAMVIGVGTYESMKEGLKNYITAFPNGELKSEAQIILSTMASFEKALGSLGTQFADVIDAQIPEIMKVNKQAAAYQFDKNTWLVGSDQSTLIGSGERTIAVHTGNGSIQGNGGNDILVAFNSKYLNGKALTVDGGVGNDKLFSIGGAGAILKGGAGSDWLVGWGGEDHLWGGDGTGRDDKASDIFTVSGDTFIHDAQTSDYVTWGPLVLTGGVQQAWMEGGWAYWTPFSSVLSAALPLTFLGPLGAAGVLTDVVTANIFRYGLTQSGQLIVEFGRGRLGHAVIENYQLDLTTGAASGHIVAFRQEIGRSSLADFVAYVNLALKASFGTGIDGTDPLVLDLDGDGIELQGRQAADIYFNFGLEGFGVRTAWVRKDDAFLARDLNGNGKVDDASELFGNATTSGFAHLRTLDSNKDGRITISDAAFGTLRLWQDRNGNGVTDAGELRTLGEAGIIAISLNTRAPPAGQIAGSTVEAVATFTRANGTSSTIADVRLDSNATDSRYLGDRTVSAAADALPDLKGYGRVMDLSVAMTKDAALLSRIAKLNDLKADTTWAAREKAVAAVLFRWAGVDDVAPVRMGEGEFDTRKLAFLETYFGYELTPRDEAGTPAETNLNELIASWNDVLAKETLRLAVQGPLKSLFKGINYDAAADRFSSASPYSLAEAFKSALGQLSGNAATALKEWNGTWAPLLAELGEALDRADRINVRTDYAVQSLVRAYEGTKTSLSLKQLVAGLGFDGVHVGTAGANTLDRGGAEGLQVYIGGGGNDRLVGGAGQDVYVFGNNFGRDTIEDAEGGGIDSGDRVRFATLLSKDVVLSRSDTDLIIKVKGKADQIVIKQQFTAPEVTFGGMPYGNDYGIEEIQFADGKIFEAIDIAAAIGLGTNGKDTIVGTSQADEIEGLRGDDRLIGGDNGDTYYVTKGDGRDIIRDEMTNPLLNAPDSLVLLGGIRQQDIRLSRNKDGNDLFITYGDGKNSITIQGQFSYDSLGYETKLALNSRIEAIFFEAGGAWSWLNVQERLIEQYTTAKNDITYGFGTSDQFKASAGNDLLIGFDGGDTYRFERGSGRDIIDDRSKYPETFISGLIGYSWGADDTVIFGAGIRQSDLTFRRLGETTDLEISIKGTKDTLTLKGQFDAVKLDLFNLLGIAWFNRIEKFQFADGSSLSWLDILRKVTTGTRGNDYLYGAYHPDIMDGGAGKDYLSGGDDGDVYIFGRGYGQDTIDDRQTNVATTTPDILRFKAGLKVSDITFRRDGETKDLLIGIKGTTDLVRINGQYDVFETGPFGAQSFSQIEEFQWADGTKKSWQTIAQEAINAAKTNGNDKIIGTHFDDVLDGGKGNDQLIGGNGNDTYIFGPHYGADTIEDGRDNILSGGTDTIRFGKGLSIKNTKFSKVFGIDDLKISMADGSTLIVKAMFDVVFAIGQYEFNRIEKFIFDDNPSRVYSSFEIEKIILSQARTSGNDTIEGFRLNDIIDGGRGNDRLIGSDGDDTYIFKRGYGADVIEDRISNPFAGGTDDRIVFGSDIRPDHVRVTQSVNAANIILSIKGTSDKITIIDAFDRFAGVEKIQFGNGTTWDKAKLQQLALRTATTSKDDKIIGYEGDDLLEGGGGNDILYGNYGKDRLIGGAGNDFLQGGSDSDVYVYSRGSGIDRIYDVEDWGGETDTLEFSAGILPNQLKVTQSDDANDLVISIIGTGDRIILDQALAGKQYEIEKVQFADGTVWGHATLLARSTTPTTGNDMFWGDGNANTLKGGAGNDTLIGRDGDDTLIGGTGNDVLEGGANSDTYVINRGDGVDRIFDQEWDGGTDTLQFGKDILPSQIRVQQADEGNDFVLSIAGTRDRITLDQALSDWDRHIEQVRFADGTVWSHADLLARSAAPTNGNDTFRGDEKANTLKGGNGNDTLIGRDGDDTLVGGTGNDVLEGGANSDTYVINRGDSVDRIFDQEWDGGIDTLQLGKGILPGQIKVQQADEGNDFVLSIIGTRDKVVLDQAVSGWGNHIEYVRFADRTVWSHADLLAKSTVPTSGNDSFWGDEKSNLLRGGKGSDVLHGQDGDDTLVGGPGSDVLEGGGGSDTLVFDSSLSSNVDHIVDFWEADDTICLAKSVFSSLAPGELSSRSFKDLAVGRIDADDRIIYNQDTGVLAYDADGSGKAAKSIPFAILDNRPSIDQTDFIIG